MEGMRYMAAWRPHIGQRWHCKTTRSSISGEIVQLKGELVLFRVPNMGERWLHSSVLKENFFPISPVAGVIS